MAEEAHVDRRMFTKELREAWRVVAKDTCREAGEDVASSMWGILRRVQETTKHQKPGGWGWWSPEVKMPNGFVRESIKVGDYTGTTVGGWLRMSDLYYPIEGGTQRGKRGWGRRGGENYGIVQGKRKAREVYLESASRGPSKPQPFLRPAIEANEARIAEALAAKWNQASVGGGNG